MVYPTFDHCTRGKSVLRYLKRTINFGVIYEKGLKDIKVMGYTDSDFASDVEDRKSTSGQVFFLGGLPITRNSLKQKVVGLPSCEIEYIEITLVVCQGVWITRLVKDVMGVEIKGVKFIIDNQSAIMQSKTSAPHALSLH